MSDEEAAAPEAPDPASAPPPNAATPPRRRVGAGRAVLALFVAVALLLLAFTNRQEVGRVLLQLTLVWLPLLVLVYLPTLLRRWKELLLAAGATALALGAVGLAGPWLKPMLVPALYDVSVDHRWHECPLCPWDDGVRTSKESWAPSKDDFNVIILGDSFAAGEEIEDRLDAFPFVVEDALRAARPDLDVRVFNFGWVSSSPLLQKRQLRELGAFYEPDLVVQTIDMTDFHDDLTYEKRLRELRLFEPERFSVWRILAVRLGMLVGTADPASWLRENMAPSVAARLAPKPVETAQSAGIGERFFVLSRPLEETSPEMEPTWKAITETQATAEELGARFAVAVLPRYQHYDPTECPNDWERGVFPSSPDHIYGPFEFLRQKGETVDFPVFSLLPDFQRSTERPTVLEHDPHYNATGHRIAGEAIARYLLQGGLVSEAAAP